MRDVKDFREDAEKTLAAATSGAGRRRALPLAVLALFSACALLLVLGGSRAAAVTGPFTDPPRTDAVVPQPDTAAGGAAPAQNYGKFSHSYPGAHAALTGRSSCSICHDRRDNSVMPRLPGHKDCISCHQTQFTTPGSPLCTICHTNVSEQNPPLKPFPSTLAGFTAEFDHAQHSVGAARPQAGCASCHAPARRNVAKSIPAGFNAHQTCYQCHTPGRRGGGGDLGSCGACHGPGRFAPVSTGGRSYGIGFSHADHGPGQNLNCDSCHNVAGRGAARGRQVTSTFPAQHFPNTRAQTCATCHNNQRSFGEGNFNDCKRCHTGTTFRL